MTLKGGIKQLVAKYQCNKKIYMIKKKVTEFLKTTPFFFRMLIYSINIGFRLK